MTMRKWILILAAFMAWTCVGQKDDPEPEPEPDVPEQPGGATEGTRFYHRVLALEFTGTWCQYCPNMSKALEEAQELRPGRLVDISVHAYDDYAPDCADYWVSLFSITGYPSMVLDMDGSTTFNTQQASVMTDYVDRVVPEEACGMAISCADGKLTIKVKAAEEGEYALSVAVVEDGLVSSQVGYGDNYLHRSVLRRYLSSLAGDSIGPLKAGEEVSRKYDVTLADKQRVVAYVTKGGICVNAISCKDKETIPYTYEEDD